MFVYELSGCGFKSRCRKYLVVHWRQTSNTSRPVTFKKYFAKKKKKDQNEFLPV